jgi:hypothetical protein
MGAAKYIKTIAPETVSEVPIAVITSPNVHNDKALFPFPAGTRRAFRATFPKTTIYISKHLGTQLVRPPTLDYFKFESKHIMKETHEA